MIQFIWFPLAIKAVGVLLIGMSLSNLLYPLQIIGWIWGDGRPISDFQILASAIASLGPLVQFVFGLYLLLVGQRIIARCLKMVDGHCIVCGYDVRGLEAKVCPECGTELEEKAGDGPVMSVDDSSGNEHV